MRNVTVIVTWSPVTCYSKLFIWRTLLIVGTARADTLKSSSEEEQGRREVGKGAKRREGGSRRSTLDEAYFVVGPAFVPRAGAGAAASGGDWIQFTFVSPSGRLCVVVCVPSAHVCVCLEKLRKNFLCHTWKFQLQIWNWNTTRGKFWMKRSRARSLEWRMESIVSTFLYTFPVFIILSIFICVCGLFRFSVSVCCSVLLSFLLRISNFCFCCSFSFFFIFWHLQKASNLWRLYVLRGHAHCVRQCAWFIIYSVAQQRGRRTGGT